MNRPGPAWLALAEACALSAWLGAAGFFAAVAAPAAFSVLPTPSLAGAIVGRLLPPLFLTGIAAGAVVLAAELRWRDGTRRVRLVASAVIIVACAAAQFVVGGRIERLRAGVSVPISTLAANDPRRIEFGRMHALSVAALGAAIVAAAAAVGTMARTARAAA